MEQITIGSAVYWCRWLHLLLYEVSPDHCYYLLPNRWGRGRGKRGWKWCGFSKPWPWSKFTHSWCWNWEMALKAVHANRLKQDQLFSILLFCFDFHVSYHFFTCLCFPSAFDLSSPDPWPFLLEADKRELRVDMQESLDTAIFFHQ